MMTVMRRIKAGALAWLAAAICVLPVLAGCNSSPPPPLPPTIADIRLITAMDANPDIDGRPSPVVVRVYELTSPYALMQADFMRIFTAETAALGADLRSRAEFILAPGQQQSLLIEMKPDSHGIAVVALFRDYLNANWRGYAEIIPNRTTAMQAEIGARHVVLTRSGQ